MSDISMCSTNICPLKETCYRHKATPDKYWQSYTSFKYDEETKSCKHYWKYVKSDKDEKEKV